MARRKPPEQSQPPQMPERLRHRPVTTEQILSWVDPDERPPRYWFSEGGPDCTEGELWFWRHVVAHSRWSDARCAWRTEHDPPSDRMY